MRTAVVKHNSIITSHRIDPSFHLSDAITFREQLKSGPYEFLSINDVVEKVFLGNIFSRIFVKDAVHGVPYLAASDTVLANLDTGRYLSNSQASKLSYLKLKKGWILITCSGTLGNVTYTNSNYENRIATHDLIRIIPNDKKMLRGCLYSFLASKYGYNQMTQSRFGGVVKHINADHISNMIIPHFPESFQKKVDDLIQESARLREEATDALEEAQKLLKQEANLRDLTPGDYDYYGPRNDKRNVSCFVRNIKEIGSLTFHAFNHSERIRKTINLLTDCNKISLFDALDESKFQSPSGVEVIELEKGHGIMLINQTDIFNNVVEGKWIAKKTKYQKNLLQYGEVLIAKIGTLGEGETFCRVIFVGEELKGQLISSAFYRFRGTRTIPSGYLYAWLSSDYGFRFIRSTQYGTKQCYPNTTLLYRMPLPIISQEKIIEIDLIVKKAHSLRYEANIKERKAISLVESEIEKWNNN
jgi:restriction endonuclease S subunit